MSLNWDASKTAAAAARRDAKTRRDSFDAEGNIGARTAEDVLIMTLTRLIEGAAWYCLFTGVNEVNAKTLDTFAKRVWLHARLHGSLYADGWVPSLEELMTVVGLTTNASPMSFLAFSRKTAELYVGDAMTRSRNMEPGFQLRFANTMTERKPVEIGFAKSA